MTCHITVMLLQSLKTSSRDKNWSVGKNLIDNSSFAHTRASSGCHFDVTQRINVVYNKIRNPVNFPSNGFCHRHSVNGNFPSSFCYPHFLIRIFPSAFYHPHFSIRISSSAFHHPHFIIRIFLSAIRHPPPSGPHFTETPSMDLKIFWYIVLLR